MVRASRLHREGQGFESLIAHTMVCYVYILYNKQHDKFYIGQTYSLKKRIAEHKAGLGNYTSRYGEWLFVYYEKVVDRAQAMSREKYFKSLKSKVFLKEFIKKQRTSSVGWVPITIGIYTERVRGSNPLASTISWKQKY